MVKRFIRPIIFALLVSILTNAGDWAFNGEVFAHELDHEHHVLSPDPAAPLEAHERALVTDEGHPNAAIHLCLHAAGQYQPFFFTAPLTIPVSAGMEVQASFISVAIPESIPDSLLRPPRLIFSS